MKLSDYMLSTVRTLVPIGVAAVLSWLAVRFGFVVDEQTSAGLVILFTALATSGYYALVRALEGWWPWLGVLLGAPTEPIYPRPVAPAGTRVEPAKYLGRIK